MKKIEGLKGSGTKYAGVKVVFEGMRDNCFAIIIFCSNNSLLATVELVKHIEEKYEFDDYPNWYFYEEPKTKEVAAFVYLRNNPEPQHIPHASDFLVTREEAEEWCRSSGKKLIKWPYGEIITIED